MREVSVHRAGLGYLTQYFNALEELKVRLEDDVELECSTSASEKPDYFWTKEVICYISYCIHFILIQTWLILSVCNGILIACYKEMDMFAYHEKIA